MAAESMWAPEPEIDRWSPGSRAYPPLTIPPMPSHAPRTTMPEWCHRTREEVELLRAEALEEVKLGSYDNDPMSLVDGRRRMNLAANHPEDCTRGIIATCRWLLGETITGPVTGYDCEYPYSARDWASEMRAAHDIAWRETAMERGERGRRDFDFGQGVFYTLVWAEDQGDGFGGPAKRPLKAAGED